jgi:hypothetical protein
MGAMGSGPRFRQKTVEPIYEELIRQAARSEVLHTLVPDRLRQPAADVVGFVWLFGKRWLRRAADDLVAIES